MSKAKITDYNSQSSLKLVHTLIHDLKNPLTVALGYIQLLQMREHSVSDKNKILITHSIEAIYNQLSILDNISDCVKIEDGSLILHSKDIDVDNIINLVISNIEKKENFNNYIFSTTNNNTKVYADEQLVTRAIHNIFEHVRLNTHVEAEIRIKSYSDTNDRINYIEFEDDGELLLPENYESIFDMCSEINLVTKSGRWDTGVFLGFSKKLFGAMNGDIVAVDSGSTGAKFVVTLPLTTV